MQKNKLVYVLSAVLILVGLASFGFVKADNENGSGEDHGDSMQAQEAHKNGSTLEVHIYDNGKVLVRGAKVTSISGNTIDASISWGTLNLNWAVNVMPNSHFIRRFGGNINSISEISVGDLVSFQGTLVTTSTSPVMVDASVVKDWSIQNQNSSLSGTVKSIDAANLKFVFTTKNGDVTVITSTGTIFKKGDNAGAFTDVVVGGQVSAKGIYNSQLMQLTASQVKISVPGSAENN